jgi:HAUS augmin-like complex subunit 1
MDQPVDLLPNALFSPSKAAQQRAQAQEWHQVDAWLSARYQGRSIPQFERSEDTLRALLALASANERADDERDLLWAAQKDAAAELAAAKERRAAEDGRAAQRQGLLAGLERGLSRDGRACLDALATAAAALDVTPPPRRRRRRRQDGSGRGRGGAAGGGKPDRAAPPPPLELAIACAITRRTLTVQAMARQLAHLQQLQRALEAELAGLRSQALELRAATAFQAPAALQRQTLDWTRNTKLLRAKLAEYADRLAALSANGAGGGGGPAEDVAGLVAQERRNGMLEEKLFAIETEISAYKGLPPNRDAAVEEVRKMEQEAARLERQLDAQFEGLVEKG